MGDRPEVPEVPVKVLLKQSTFRQLYAHAEYRSTTVADLLSRLADASLVPLPDQGRKPLVRLSDEDRAVARRLLLEEGWSRHAVAARFDVSLGTVANILRDAEEGADRG